MVEKNNKFKSQNFLCFGLRKSSMFHETFRKFKSKIYHHGYNYC